MWPTFNKDEFSSLQVHQNWGDGVTTIWESATGNKDTNHAAFLKVLSSLHYPELTVTRPPAHSLELCGGGWNQSNLECPSTAQLRKPVPAFKRFMNPDLYILNQQ